MNWLELSIDTSHEGLEPVCALLSAHGVDSLVIDEEADFLDFLEHNRRYWDYVDEALLREKRGKCRVTFYLPEDGWHALAQVRVALSALKKQQPSYAPLLLSMKNVADEDWENNWKQFYRPMEIGERLLIVPEWEQTEREGRVRVVLNPGLTFGTGSHATTHLCLTALDHLIHGGETVLDLGCGSGILSIAALRLGAARAFACDVDPVCVKIARDNAVRNGIDPSRFTVRAGDVTEDRALTQELSGGYDLVMANIVADVILALAPKVRPLLRAGGTFLCSGVIDTRADEVRQGLTEAGWDIFEADTAEGWCAFLCR